jgi:pSer/pThr/pTyr-binding forkhead associated (FHA) protein
LERSRDLATLLLQNGAERLPRLAVMRSRVSLGRDPGNDLVLAEPSVSRHHAELRLQGGVWLLTDLQSAKGSWVDQERIYDRAPLAPGSVVRLGDVELAFAPHDRWEDSPPEIRAETEAADASPLFVLPERRRPLLPRLLYLAAVAAVLITAYLVLRAG